MLQQQDDWDLNKRLFANNPNHDHLTCFSFPVFFLLYQNYQIYNMSMAEYKMKRDACRPKVLDKYEIIGFISSGTYGRVYKARSRNK